LNPSFPSTIQLRLKINEPSMAISISQIATYRYFLKPSFSFYVACTFRLSLSKLLVVYRNSLVNFKRTTSLYGKLK
jgi:hypothetical protein